MKLYAILVGINEYPASPLSQCVSDAQKMKKYLDSISSAFEEVNILELHDQNANKTRVVLEIERHLYQAKDEDVAFFYYSGHGALESANGLFKDQHNGALESMVLYADRMEAKAFLADKELRYLWHKMPNNPHLVSVVDSCHSGDIVRSYKEEEKKDMVKRLSGVFTHRDYKDFIFAGDDSVESEVDGKLEINIPFKNSIHVAACLSSESSWEDARGGVFTRYLLSLLETTGGKLSYLDIARWSKMSIAEVTRKKQTPKVSIQGKGDLSAYSSWLQLHDQTDRLESGMVVNNVQKGWIYSRGSLLGIKEDMEITIDVDGKEITATTSSVSLEDSTLSISISDSSEMDTSRSYTAKTSETTHSTLSLYINNIDFNEEAEQIVMDHLSENELVQLSDLSEADFAVNIFNDYVYISLPDSEFQPLNKQTNVEELASEKSKAEFKDVIASCVKWNHFNTLENPSNDYDEQAILVEARVHDEKNTSDSGEWEDISDGFLKFAGVQGLIDDDQWARGFQIKVTNLTQEPLHIGALLLTSDLGISSSPFDSRSIQLEPAGSAGDSKLFYDHDGSVMGTVLDQYKEVYNWKEEWFAIKFIFNNFDDFTASLQSDEFQQAALSKPLLLERRTLTLRSASEKGSMSFNKFKKVTKKWGTSSCRIEMSNPTHNQVTGDLKEFFDSYTESDELGPFIKELYFEEVWNGSHFELRLKDNVNQSAEDARATDVWIVQRLNALYNGVRRRRFRRQKNRTGPIGIAEGDSWFLYPKPGVRDTLDYIMDDYRLLSLADAGDEIADYVANNELIEKVGEIKPDFVLISGGGNDVLGESVQDVLLNGKPNGLEGSEYINAKEYKKKLDLLDDGYRMFFEKLTELAPGVQIFVHGYDYIPANRSEKIIKKGWANKYMIKYGVTDWKTRDKIIHHLIDKFNDMMADYEKEFSFVHYVNNLKTVAHSEWMDEIHPNNVGYRKVADNFKRKLKSVNFPQSS